MLSHHKTLGNWHGIIVQSLILSTPPMYENDAKVLFWWKIVSIKQFISNRQTFGFLLQLPSEVNDSTCSGDS